MHLCCIIPDRVRHYVQGLIVVSPLLTQHAQGPHPLPSMLPRPQDLCPPRHQLLQHLHPLQAALQVGGSLAPCATSLQNLHSFYCASTGMAAHQLVV